MRIRTPKPAELEAALVARGAAAQVVAPDRIEVAGASPEQIGTLAAELGIPIFEAITDGVDLEDVFFQLTADRGSEEGS